MIREGGLERDRYHTSCETGYHECDRWWWVAPTPSPKTALTQSQLVSCTGELGYDGLLYDRFLHMTDDMLGPSPMHIKHSSYVYDGFDI